MSRQLSNKSRPEVVFADTATGADLLSSVDTSVMGQ